MKGNITRHRTEIRTSCSPFYYVVIANYLLLCFVSSQSTGWTPLFYAAEGGHRNIAQLLLDKGANPHLRDTVSIRAIGSTYLEFCVCAWHTIQ